jgi:hypothetical protein
MPQAHQAASSGGYATDGTRVGKTIAGDPRKAPSLSRDVKGSKAGAYVTLIWVFMVRGCTSQRIL